MTYENLIDLHNMVTHDFKILEFLFKFLWFLAANQSLVNVCTYPTQKYVQVISFVGSTKHFFTIDISEIM